MDKHSSLLRKSIIYGQKKFYNIGHKSDITSKMTGDKLIGMTFFATVARGIVS
jgi:hypothetical protein